jgi:hypothetical protein
VVDFINELTSTSNAPKKKSPVQPQKASKPTKLKAGPRKSLIPEESEALPAPPPPLPSNPKIKDVIADSEIGKDKLLSVEELKNNRRFAIICHEVLGKPKALRN